MICTSMLRHAQPLQAGQQVPRLGGRREREAGEHAERALRQQRQAGEQAGLADASRPSTSVRGPVAMNGISTAKTTNGTSTTIRRSR